MSETNRATAREIAHRHLAAGDPLGWFEALYAQAGGDEAIISWADLAPNSNLIDWLDRTSAAGPGRALKVGSGLGDDAEELARRDFDTTAFDISPSAVAWTRRRFPHSGVSYMVADLFAAPTGWASSFELVLESYTLQVLPPQLRPDAMRCIASFIAPGGTLLVIARGREPDEPKGRMPWPLTRGELSRFEAFGLQEIAFEDYMDREDPPVRRLRLTYVDVSDS